MFFFFVVVVVEANSSQITLTIIAPGGIEGEIPRRHPSSSSVYIVKYLQSKYTVSKPEKNLALLNQGPYGIVVS